MKQILRKLAENRFIVRLNSNGTRIDDKTVQTLAELGNIFRIHVSLYGATAIVHDSITRAPGSFNKTMHALHCMKEAGLPIRINCCVMQSNFADYPNIRNQIADKLGIPVRFDSVIFPRDDNTTSNLEELLDDEQDEVFQHDRHAQKASNRSEETRQKMCKAGLSFFAIAEDGNVYPCLKMKKHSGASMGNVLQQSFSEIWWGSPTAEALRRPLRERLRDCAACQLQF